MRGYSFLLLAFFYFSHAAFTQVKPNRASPNATNLFIEVAGNAGALSLNYDMRFFKRSNGFGGRIGVGAGTNPAHLFPEAVLTIPLALNYLLGGGPHYFEAAAGITIGEGSFAGKVHNSGDSRYFVPGVGYRFQPLHRGFTFRAFISPLIGHTKRFFGGASFGIRF